MKYFIIVVLIIVFIGIVGWVWIGRGWGQNPPDVVYASNSPEEAAVEFDEKKIRDSGDGSLSSMKDSSVLLPEVSCLLEQFDESKDPKYITKAVSQTGRYTPYTPEESIESRVVLLHSLSPFYDPTYDRNPPPPSSMRVRPPDGYMVGVRPADIEDPEMRMEYAGKIKEKEESSRIHKTQRPIRKLMRDLVRLYSIQDGASLESIERQLQEYEIPHEMIDSMLKMARQKGVD